jgi:hypothetical protein
MIPPHVNIDCVYSGGGLAFSVSLAPSLDSDLLVMSVVFTVTVDLISCCASCTTATVYVHQPFLDFPSSAVGDLI